jgi:hypothetical protein
MRWIRTANELSSAGSPGVTVPRLEFIPKHPSFLNRISSKPSEILRRLPTDSHSVDFAYLWVPEDNPSEASLRRIVEGERLGVNQRYLYKHRKP